MPDGNDHLALKDALAEELQAIRPDKAADDPGTSGTPDPQAEGKSTRASTIYDTLYAADLWGLALSGGGIRSATFALGLLQGMARAGLLMRFDYLSTVSGGGYIGSWLSSWASRDKEKGFAGVVEDLARIPSDGSEPKPVRHLRSFTAYLTPRTGILSADTWTLVATYLRNLLLNWLMIIPLLTALILTPKIGLALVRLRSDAWITGFIEANRSIAAPITAVLGLLSLLLGMYYVFARLAWPASKAGDWPGKQKDFLIHCLLPIMLASILLPLAWAWWPGPQDGWLSLICFAVLGLLLRVGAWGIALRRAGKVDTLEDRQDRLRYHDLLWAVALTGAIGGALVWLMATNLFGAIQENIGNGYNTSSGLTLLVYICFAPPLLLLTLLVTEALFIGLASRSTDDDDREWWGRAGAWLLIAGLFWMAVRLLVLLGPLVLYWLETEAPVIVSALGGISGIATALMGMSAKSAAAPGKPAPDGFAGFLRGIALSLFAAIFVCMLFAALSLIADLILTRVEPSQLVATPFCSVADAKSQSWSMLGQWWTWCGSRIAMRAESLGLVPIILAIVILVVVGLAVQPWINVNRFSLHAMYRARLIRAYLGASNDTRHPEPFTGFDPRDNIHMTALWPGIPDSQTPRRPPFHLVNVALNLVSLTAERLAWQQRKAESMTISPLHCGCGIDEIGYRPSTAYAQGSDSSLRGRPGLHHAVERIVEFGRRLTEAPQLPPPPEPEGITLGTAMTISGAAASPNMGYHSSPIVALIMTLFNLRLGAWLGNPGRAGDETFKGDGPRFTAKYLAYEALGLTNDEADFVYLSDGGHFENLGLYELVRRRCRVIVVSDAGCDPDFLFEDLGNAVRKIRIDFGIDITFANFEMHPRLEAGSSQPPAGRYWAIGKIHYPENVEGWLVYIKPGLYGGEPEDVLSYAATHPAFPHEPTSDQWFDESQFESYRRLGLHVAETLFGTKAGTFTAETFSRLQHIAATPAAKVSETRARLIRRPSARGWFGRPS